MSTASIRLTWPKPSVSRTGSVAAASGTASATVNQRGQAYRSASGTSSQVSRSVSAARLTSVFSQPATMVGRIAIGAIASAANGGEGETSVGPGDTEWARVPPGLHQTHAPGEIFCGEKRDYPPHRPTAH